MKKLTDFAKQALGGLFVLVISGIVIEYIRYNFIEHREENSVQASSYYLPPPIYDKSYSINNSSITEDSQEITEKQYDTSDLNEQYYTPSLDSQETLDNNALPMQQDTANNTQTPPPQQNNSNNRYSHYPPPPPHHHSEGKYSHYPPPPPHHLNNNSEGRYYPPPKQ